jgi:hypothetical protein
LGLGFKVGRSAQIPYPKTGLLFALALCAAVFGLASPAFADKIPNRIAVFAFLDKVTARISTKPIPLNQTFQFGSLKVTPRACFTRPATEEPKTTTFVEVDDQKLDGTTQRIFSGWMLAQSPGLHAVEHPVYDVWLTDCQKPAGGAAPVAKAPAAPAATEASAADTADAQQPDAATLDALPVKTHHVKRQ